MGHPLEEEVVHHGHDVQGHEGGVGQAADDDDGHTAHQLAGHVVAEQHHHHAQDGGQGGHQDGTHTGLAGGDQGVPAVHAAQPQLVGIVHKQDAVVDNGAHQDDEAHHAHHAPLLAAAEQ